MVVSVPTYVAVGPLGAVPAVKESVAVPTVTLSEAVAVTVRFTALATDAGAVYNPLLEIEPGAGLPGLLALLMVQVTALFGVPVTCRSELLGLPATQAGALRRYIYSDQRTLEEHSADAPRLNLGSSW